jgi:uroporphyrinogen decarboxylase
VVNDRQRFLQACARDAVDRPPIWMMRQAGRALPEYRALREKHSFLQLVQTPDLATEVTLQPIRRFGFDAAILFSDILVIPEAVGQSYQFRDGGGVNMAFPIQSSKDTAKLCWEGVPDRLQYVAKALRLIKKELHGQTALIGFGGSPWTLANFMVEGGSSRAFTQALAWHQADPAGLEQFLDQLAGVLIEYFKMQIEAGVDALQIFDSLGYCAPVEQYEQLSTRWIAKIVHALPKTTPIIVFGRAPQTHLTSLIATSSPVIGIDHTVNIREALAVIPPSVAMQGNLDPSALLGTAETARASANRLLEAVHGREGYLFNLGHGLLPATPVENIAAVVDCVRNYRWGK